MEQAFKAVKNLVEVFKANERNYLAPTYQESHVRQDFIDKFFTALGWDVTHERQKNPHEYEVQIENPVNGGGVQQRADYAFFMKPNFRDPKFFVEAKKPARKLKDPDFFYQAMRYGWNGNTPIAILTDFEQFYVIDSRLKPSIKDALEREIKSFRYTDYADEEKFRWIYYLFSHEAVADGAIEKFAAGLSKPKGKVVRGAARTQPVDEVFLAELDTYRENLAKSFKKSNQQLQGEELTEAVQRTIDRLVFIRFLEDKLIEPDKEIGALAERKMAWELFASHCRKMDPKYNGLIFKPHPVIDSKDFRPPDEKVFQEMCNGLAGPESPYNFAQIPISILGNIYERFLGKVVHATDKRVRVEEKPEVRKAGGVYYTPNYIVRYIVSETVGKLIEGKTPEEISKMAFADIACGSGSFLIEVYDLLLKHHEHYYREHPQKAKRGDLSNRGGLKVLSLKKRQEILTNNIYGVDLDYQATEVTQLSLYLKLLEDVSTNEAFQFTLLKEKILPNLGNNIVCGNSLIGTDITEGSLFPDIDESRIKPMNFEDVFPTVMKRGGFDAVVGNPPYVRIQGFDRTQAEYFTKNYDAAYRNYDIYIVFVERALSKLNKYGLLGFILPHKFFSAEYGEGLRERIAKGRNLFKVVHFGEAQVFPDATTYTCLLFLTSSRSNEFDFVKVMELHEWVKHQDVQGVVITEDAVSKSPWVFGAAAEDKLFRKLQSSSRKASQLLRSFVGTQTSAEDVFVLEDCRTKGGMIRGHSGALDENVDVEVGICRPFLRGKDIRRYRPLISDAILICPYKIGSAEFELMEESAIKKDYPKAYRYLQANKSNLAKREGGRFRGSNWYAFGYPKSMTEFSKPKIVVPDYNNEPSFTVDKAGHFFKTGYGVILMDPNYDAYYVLGLINSKLLFWSLKRVSTALRGGYFRFWTKYIEQLPLHIIDFGDAREKSRHDDIVKLVERMLAANEQLSKAKTEADTTRLERECESLDRQIDRAVYELYGLTEEEIKVVEGVG